ncbi:MAG: hypothetical protein ACNS62_20960 [Candidatus Cyclobacteriaceae bacterium M3_2C_046]
MTKEKLKNMNLEELHKIGKTYRLAAIVLTGIVLIMAILSILHYQASGFNFMVFLPLFFLPLVLANALAAKRFHQEIVLRQHEENQ